jgi:hypothetical protein
MVKKAQKVIWKWRVSAKEIFGLDLPHGAQILSVQMLDGAPHLWAIVSPDAALETRTFRLLPTGLLFDVDAMSPSKQTHVGTFQLVNDGGNVFVFHLFETFIYEGN